jgi:hypothetical protein
VRMRARKPWVRARLTFDGWYVRFMIYPWGGSPARPSNPLARGKPAIITDMAHGHQKPLESYRVRPAIFCRAHRWLKRISRPLSSLWISDSSV